MKIKVKLIISVLTVISFLLRSVFSSAIELVNEKALFDNAEYETGIHNDINCATFMIPEHLGEIKDRFQGSSGKMVIHIQDAHCNYYAQQKINDIISFIVEEYGVGVLNVEGGSGKYDLSPFTEITGDDIREEVSEYFLKKGEINAAEFYAINNPDKLELWGIEDKELYLKNLDVYRSSLRYKTEAQVMLKELDRRFGDLKKKFFNRDLMELDRRYGEYKAGLGDFKDYLMFLFGEASSLDVDLKGLENIEWLYGSVKIEDTIDFHKANTERDLLVEQLKAYLSKNELRGLMSAVVDYKIRKISKNDFYAFLMEKAEETRCDRQEYKDFFDYCEYLMLYSKVDRAKVMDELDDLEKRIKDVLFENETQRTLDRLSRNLAILKNIFSFSLTLEDYEYYIKDKDHFTCLVFLDFINKHQTVSPERAELNITKLDGYREAILKFFQYSFERDRLFLKNMRFSGDAAQGQPRTSFILTGGFHTENLCELLKKNGISYISLMPRFRAEENYESPYFELLAGTSSEAADMMRAVLARASSLMVANKLNPEINSAVNGEDAGIILRGEILIREMVEHGFKVTLREDKEDSTPVIFGASSKANIDITASELIRKIQDEDYLRLITDKLRETLDFSLTGDLRNFEIWADTIEAYSNKGLDDTDLIIIGMRLGLGYMDIGRIVSRAPKKTEYLTDFYKSLPDDGKHNLYLFRDAFFLYETERLYGGSPELFYFSKFMLELFSNKAISMAFQVNILFKEVKTAMGLGEKDEVPSGQFNAFKENFYRFLKDIYNLDVDSLGKDKKLYGLSYKEILGFKSAIDKFMTYLGTLRVSPEDMINNGIRVIDSSQVGTLVMFSEAASRLYLEQLGLNEAEARDKVDAKMFFSYLSPELGFTRNKDVNKGHFVERNTWPVDIDKSMPLNDEGYPNFLEVEKDKLKFLFEEIVLTNKIQEQLSDNDAPVEPSGNIRYRPVIGVIKNILAILSPLKLFLDIRTMMLSAVSFAAVLAGTMNVAETSIDPSIFSETVLPEMKQATDSRRESDRQNILVISREGIMVYVYKENVNGKTSIGVDVKTDLPADDIRVKRAQTDALRDLLEHSEIYEMTGELIDNVERMLNKGLTESVRSLEISKDTRYRLTSGLKDLMGENYFTEPVNVEYSVDISNSPKYQELSRKAYDLLVSKNVIYPEAERYPVLFLEGLNIPGFAMAIEGPDVVLVGLDELLALQAEGKDIVQELAVKIAHEAVHLNNSINQPTISPLEDEALAFGMTARAVETFGDTPVQVEVQRMVEEGFWTLVKNKDPDGTPVISRLLGIPDINDIYYTDVNIVFEAGKITGVDIDLFDLTSMERISRRVRVTDGKILMMLFKEEPVTEPNDIVNGTPDVFFFDPEAFETFDGYEDLLPDEILKRGMPGFIGKPLDKDGIPVKGLSRIEEDEDSITIYAGEDIIAAIPLAKTNGRVKAVNKDEALRDIRNLLENRKGVPLHMEENISRLLSLLDVESIEKIVLLDEGSEGAEIKGLFYGKRLYLNESLFNNPLALLHEFGEGHMPIPKGERYEGLTRHTLMRGTGKDVRAAFNELSSEGKIPAEISASELIDMLESELSRMAEKGAISATRVQQLTSNISGSYLSDSEMALIRYNADNGLKGRECLEGAQDFIDPAGNIALTQNIRVLTDDLRLGTLNIYLLPYGSIESVQAQEELSRETSRRFRKMGVGTLVFHYNESNPFQAQLRKALDIAMRRENKDKLPKIYISTFDKDRTDTLISNFLKEEKYTPETSEQIRKGILIGSDTLPEGVENVSDLMMDDVRVISIGSAILNDNRLRVNMNFSAERLFENRLRMLGAFVDSGILSPDVLSDKTPEGLENVMEKLYIGDIIMKITPIRWESIKEYYDSMKQVLRSL